MVRVKISSAAPASWPRRKPSSERSSRCAGNISLRGLRHVGRQFDAGGESRRRRKRRLRIRLQTQRTIQLIESVRAEAPRECIARQTEHLSDRIQSERVQRPGRIHVPFEHRQRQGRQGGLQLPAGLCIARGQAACARGADQPGSARVAA